MSQQTRLRPFLKWPGGKYRLLPTLLEHLPNRRILVEPFVGAGALFLNSRYSQIITNDINFDLINLYQQLQKFPKQTIQQARKFFTPKNNSANAYYRLRDRFNQSQDPKERAILFLYLNRHGYNGLCRYNLKGFYNVPFGDYRAPYFPEKELMDFEQRAHQITFHCESYTVLLNRFLQKSSLEHMVFYCDPPYAPLSKTANFTGYAAHRFTLEDQKKLAELAKALMHKGAYVLISNHDTAFTREIYKGARLKTLQVARSISCKGKSRQKIKEILAIYTPGILTPAR